MDAERLPDLDGLRLGRALRRVRVTAGIFGVVALVVGGVVGVPLGGMGVVIGLVAGAMSTKSMDAAVARLRSVGEAKATRRPLAVRTIGRLAVVTAAVITLLFLAPPVGLGMLLGLILYQAAFLGSMLTAVLGSGVST